MWKKFINFWRDGLAILAFIVSLWALIVPGPPAFLLAALTFASIIALWVLLPNAKDKFWSQRGVAFYPDWQKAPKKYTAEKTLQWMLKQGKPIELQIIARNGFRWLCGDETLFHSPKSSDHEQFARTQTGLQDLIRSAIEAGNSISFLIQSPDVKISTFTDYENRRLQDHTLSAIISYDQISAKLNEVPSHGGRLNLSLTSSQIRTSKVLIKRDGKPVRLIVDLGPEFAGTGQLQDALSKPFLCFSKTGCKNNPSYVNEFDTLFRSLPNPQIDFCQQTQICHDDVNGVLKNYPYHSTLRNDTAEQLARITAACIISELNPNVRSRPPVCVQLLVNHTCTTQCVMCESYKVNSASVNQMSTTDLFNALACIANIGTKSVIISGGEPLAHPDISNILQRAKTLGLNIGLLTNGISPRNNPLPVAKIASTCDWVQISIDSFVSQTYQKIRGVNGLDAVLQSINNLANANLPKMEVCFTIQRDNVDEIPTLMNSVTHLPSNVNLRLKLAHSSNSSASFLVPDANLLRENLRKLAFSPDSASRTNVQYLLDVLDKFFDDNGITHGVPLQKYMTEISTRRYFCQALHLTCTIDSNGDVYPCCFLFDDTLANPSVRSQYRLGSLRVNGGTVLVSGTSFTEIWYESETLRLLRTKFLPLDNTACSRCTRHFYQNEYLNELYRLFRKFPCYRSAIELAGQDVNPKVWV